MLYRWILQEIGKPMRRGSTIPSADIPTSGQVLHLICTEGSMAIQGGRLFVNGRSASPAEYRIGFENGTLILVVGEEGVILERREEVSADD